MSVIIKGMEMPNNCERCPFLDYEEGFCFASGEKGENGWYEFSLWAGGDKTNRHTNCPLVELPTPHGRLIDADALEDVVFEINSRHGTWDIPITRSEFKIIDRVLWEFPTIVSGSADTPTVDTPTVIEAEE